MGKGTKLTVLFFLMLIVFTYGWGEAAYARDYKYVKSKTGIANGVLNSRGAVIKKNSTFKPYKVLITAGKLNIRQKASSTSTILGNYVSGNIVDINGKSGNFLKTPDGYIAAVYTRRIEGMYITVLEDQQVINTATGKPDNRCAVQNKKYRITGSSGNNIIIRVGRINGAVTQDSVQAISDNDESKVTLGWDHIFGKSYNQKSYDEPTDYVNTKSYELGLDVLSPTWFNVSGNASKPATINISDIGDKNYVSIAHKNGYEVWARFGEMDKNRAAVEFNDPSTKKRIINQILSLALQYDIDGINVDYEALGSKNKDGFTNFMKELYPALKRANLKVSIDVTKISKTSDLYSMCYDRPNLVKYSDYLILMGYDEHVSSSKDAGSVGSNPWVEGAIKDILSQGVPSNKLILGVPFYLRDFTVVPYDAVFFNGAGKIYVQPIAVDNNKLADAKKGNVFKCTGSDGDWFLVDNNGVKGYVKKKYANFIPANALPATTDSSIIITTGGGIDFTTGSAITLTLPYDTIVMSQDSLLYRGEYEITTNKLADTKVNSYFKVISRNGDWYTVAYNNGTAYVPKSAVTFYKAETRAVSGSAMDMQDALDRISTYGGTISNDNSAKQSVGRYFKDGLLHKVWLETPDSMGWRMDFVNEYDLAGAAVWSLYWEPADGIWETIKGKLKN